VIANLWSHGLVLVAVAPCRVLDAVAEIVLVPKVVGTIILVWDNFICGLVLRALFHDLGVLKSSEKLLLLLHSFCLGSEVHLSLSFLSSSGIFRHPLHFEFKGLISRLGLKIRLFWCVVILLLDNTDGM
jgi:hypothetical protein